MLWIRFYQQLEFTSIFDFACLFAYTSKLEVFREEQAQLNTQTETCLKVVLSALESHRGIKITKNYFIIQQILDKFLCLRVRFHPTTKVVGFPAHIVNFLTISCGLDGHNIESADESPLNSNCVIKSEVVSGTRRNHNHGSGPVDF